MVLPDEISDDDSKTSDDETNKPEPEAFDSINLTTFQFRSDLKKEVYRMRIHKVKVSCPLCQLLYDYSKTCAHYNLTSPKP